MKIKNYIVTGIKVEPRSFLKAINSGLSSNVNEIELSLERDSKFLGLIPMKQKRIVKFSMKKCYDINNYLKVGSTFNPDDYSLYLK